MTTDNLQAQLDRQTSNADEWRKEAARALSLLDAANRQIAVFRAPAQRESNDVDDEAERLFWCFAAMLDPSQTGNAPLSQRDAFKRAIRPSLCAATKEVNDGLRAQLAERTRELDEALVSWGAARAPAQALGNAHPGAARQGGRVKGDSTPVYVTEAGLRACRHADGSVGIIVDEKDRPGRARAAMHLSASQAAELDRFFRTIRAADEPRSILDEAREIVHGDREQTHGAPDHNLRAIAKIWSALLRDRLRDGDDVTPQMVCLMMAGLKLARASNRPEHRDHARDTVGYIALLERCGFLEPE